MSRIEAQKEVREYSLKGKIYQKRFRQSEKGKAARKRYQQTDKFKACRRRKKYNLSSEDFERLFVQQKGRCKICNKKFDRTYTRDIHIDHDHVTNKVRGILCSKCNVALGALDDDIYKLLSAIKYLEGTIGNLLN